MSRLKTARRAPPPHPRLWPWVGLLLLAAALGVFVWWRVVSAPPAAGRPREVSVAEAAAQRTAGAFLLDVREPDEWEAFHVPGSTHIPLAQLADRVAELPRDQAIIVVCRSGNRSQQGRATLLAAGFDQVTSLAGGLQEWQTLGFPTVSGP